MRQNDFIFDIDGKKIGVARSTCNSDINMVLSEDDYWMYNTSFGLDATQSLTIADFEKCTHS